MVCSHFVSYGKRSLLIVLLLYQVSMKTQPFTHSLMLITLFFCVFFASSYTWPQRHRHKHGYRYVDTPEKMPDINFNCIDLPSNSSGEQRSSFYSTLLHSILIGLSVSDTDPASYASLNPTVQVHDGQILNPTAEIVHATSLPNAKLPVQAMQVLKPGSHSQLHLHVHKRELRKRDYNILTRTAEVTVTVLREYLSKTLFTMTR